MIEILPIHNPDSKAGNPRLMDLVQKFCEKNFGKIDFKNYQNIWVAVKGGPGEMPEVIGIACLRVVLDIPVLHSAAGAKDKTVSAMLVKRVWSAIMDQGFAGQEMLIHVASEQTEVWKEFLDGINSAPAERHLVTVHPKIQV